MIIKPFEEKDDNYTKLDNAILDYIMPTLTGNEWKILSLIIRKTRGWHKEQDKLSFSQIKEQAGIKSDPTVVKALGRLERAGYILVERTDEQWSSNSYALNTSFEVKAPDPKPKNGKGSTIKNTVDRPDEPTIETIATIENIVEPTIENIVEPTIEIKAGSTIEIIDTKEIKKPSKKKKEKEINTNLSKEMFQALIDLCGLDVEMMRGPVNQAEKKMRDNGYKPSDLKEFGAWWYSNDWRGKDGQAPTLSQVRQTWGQFQRFRKGGSVSQAQIQPELQPAQEILPPEVETLTEEQQTWKDALNRLQFSMPENIFNKWFADTIALPRSNGVFHIGTHSEAGQQWLSQRLVGQIERALSGLDGTINGVEIEVI